MNRQTKKCLINGRKSRDTVPLRGPCAIDQPSLVLILCQISVAIHGDGDTDSKRKAQKTQMFGLTPSIPSLFPPCLIFTSREIGLKFFLLLNCSECCSGGEGNSQEDPTSCSSGHPGGVQEKLVESFAFCVTPLRPFHYPWKRFSYNKKT